MKNAQINFAASAVVCLALAVKFNDWWWAFSGLGAGLLFLIVALRNDGHTLSGRATFFTIIPLFILPVLLQAGAGIFAFLVAGAFILLGEQIRKRDAAVAALMAAAQRAKAHLGGVQK